MRRVLIVGTVPYNPNSTSRAFDAYFHNWPREHLAQVFSHAKKPTKGHCGRLYQITDERLLKRRFSNREETGVVYNYDDLEDEWKDSSLRVGNSFFAALYLIGSNKGPFIYLMRKLLWSPKYWCTKQLNVWLDEFKPECVFLSFSDDFFIPEIALYVATRYNIPIVSSVGDDYFFNNQCSVSPLYYLYKYWYRRLIRRVFAHTGSAIYIGNKIRDKYNSEFGLDGETVYVTSSIERSDFRRIDTENPRITYCGNIRLGRNTSLNLIGQALGSINSSYVLDIYSNESDSTYYRLFDRNPNIRYHGSVQYAEVKRVMLNSDILVVVEGFAKKDVDATRYSLSTKVADCLASGVNILAFGSVECGAIEYLMQVGCATVCHTFNDLIVNIKQLLNDVEPQRRNYERSKEISETNHSIEGSTRRFESLVEKVVKRCWQNG